VVKNLKYIDKFLKWLGTDRNTFLTYILTLITIYILIDRIVELVILFITGIGASYWGPIGYTFAFACPIFAFLFSGSSSFAKSYKLKITYLYVYCISLYVIGVSMFVQWINGGLWLLLLSIPNYVEFVTEFSSLIKPAFQSIAVYLPLITFYPLFKWLYTVLNESKDIRDGINDYTGIDLSDKSIGRGPYTCEIVLCKDKITGKLAKIPEIRRFEPMLVVGLSGTGKTSMVYEPMIARDIEKKYFFKEISKEMGFTALKTGIAYLNRPYNNDYLNDNFNLNMLTPSAQKEQLYKAYMKKMIASDTGSKGIIYKDLGLTYVSADIESTNNMIDVARNFNIPVNLIDPNNSNSPGLNPFIFDDPSLTALAVSTVLRGMNHMNKQDAELAFRESTATQAVENLSILLKVMYPILHNGDLPNLEDMLKLLNDFDLIEDMCKKMEAIPELAEKYSLQIGYFKKNFYSASSMRNETEKYVYTAINQLDSLLRLANVRSILCNRTNNINFDKALENGEVTFLCTRRGDLGATAHIAFGLFFLLLMQFSVLRRPGNDKSRLPHFLYVDDFADYISAATEPLFTIYRKYKVGIIISAQNATQLGLKGQSKYRDTIISNSTTKLVFGGLTREENDIWEKEFGDHREWKFGVSYDTKKLEYDSKLNNPSWDWKENIKSGKLQALKFKDCAYKYKDVKGKNVYSDGQVDFLEAKYKEPHLGKKYDFSRFTNGIAEDNKIKPNRKNGDLTKQAFGTDYNGDIDPIKTDNSDTDYLFNNSDAIIFDLKKKKDQ
jgi:hypothetical protein